MVLYEVGRQTVPTQHHQSSVEPENFLEVGRQAVPIQHHQGSVEPEMCLEVGRQVVPIQHHQGLSSRFASMLNSPSQLKPYDIGVKFKSQVYGFAIRYAKQKKF